MCIAATQYSKTPPVAQTNYTVFYYLAVVQIFRNGISKFCMLNFELENKKKNFKAHFLALKEPLDTRTKTL